MSNSRQIAHLWTESALGGQQVKPLGKNTGQLKGSNFYWDGDTIYSYGRHFPIARVIETAKGKAVLFTRRSYSVTTSGHKSDVRQALHGRPEPIFYVERPDEAPRESTEKEWHTANVAQAFEYACRARGNADAKLSEAVAAVAEGNRTAKFFGWKWRVKAPADLEALKATVKAKMAKLAKENKVKNAAKAAKRKAALAIGLEYWTACRAAWVANAEAPQRPAYDTFEMDHNWNRTAPTLLRLSKDGQTVETSRGAEVPADHARRIWPLVKRLRETGGEYHKNGHTEHIGEFAITSISTDGTMIVGCHTITAGELDKMAVLLGLPACNVKGA